MIEIPKVIHYCWLSDDPLPPKIQTCIDSWKKFLPDYQIKRWSYKNFPRGKSSWVDQAYDAKKYAFAADYLRCYALFHEGGIYLDSDVEVLKSFDSLLNLPYFIGKENGGDWEAAVIGSIAGKRLFGEMLKYYDTHNFANSNEYDTTPLPKIMKSIGENLYDIEYIKSLESFNTSSSKLQILPFDYFSPKSHKTGEMELTSRTFSIHHFSASWFSKSEKIYLKIRDVFGYRFAHIISLIVKKLLP